MDRLDYAEMVPIEQAKAESQLPDRVAMVMPYPQRLRDMAWAAGEHLGLKFEKCLWVWAAFSHVIDDRCIQVVVWRVASVALPLLGLPALE